MSRDTPNLEWPYLRARCSTTFSPDPREASPLGQQRHVAVHVTVYLDALDDLATVALQAAVEVVQLDAADLAGHEVEKLAGQGLAERVLAVFLPATDEVEALLVDEAVKGGDFVGAVLQIRIHGDHDPSVCVPEPLVEGRALAVVASEFDAADTIVGQRQTLDRCPTIVGAAVVDQPDLVRKVVLAHNAVDPGRELGQ